MSKGVIASKLACLQIPENVTFSKIRTPAGASHTDLTFSECTSRELIHVRSNLKTLFFFFLKKKKNMNLDGHLQNHRFTENQNGPYGP